MSAPSLIAGIDPGLDGAIAILGDGTLTIEDMPTTPITVAGKKQRELDLPKLSQIFGWMSLRGVNKITLEHVQAWKDDGPRQAFKFGFNFCGPRAMAAVLEIPVQLVRPAVWKAAFGLTGGKSNSLALASKIMPSFSHLWPLKKHDGRAEAALLALYGARVQS